MKKLPTIFLGVGLILATIPRVTVEKTDEHFLLSVGGAVQLQSLVHVLLHAQAGLVALPQ